MAKKGTINGGKKEKKKRRKAKKKRQKQRDRDVRGVRGRERDNANHKQS